MTSRRVRLATLACVAAGTVAWTDPGHGAHEEGQDAARAIWGGEHSGLYEHNLDAAGLSDRTFTFDVYSLGGRSTDGFTSLLMPDTWAETGAKVSRDIDMSQWANLPDVSWSLAGWALGNERCPLDDSIVEIDPDYCFKFTGWMGALNSTHFPPQSYAAYDWYHQLALATAGRCVELDASLDALEASVEGGLSAETRDLADLARQQCQLEALAFEGVGHHYLQDTWSAGHTWQRWGSPQPEDWVPITGYTSLSPMWTALVVGGISGIIHGHQSFTGLADPMCAPHIDVSYIGGDECPVEDGNMVGDYYVDEMGLYQAEGVRMCTQGGVDAVLGALGDAEALGMTAAGDGVAPTEAACFTHRASDLAWYTGLVETFFVDGVEEAEALRIIGRAVPILPGELSEYETALTATREELIRMAIIADAVSLRPGAEDENTELAELRITRDDGDLLDLQFLGTLRNDGYLHRVEDGLRVLDPPPAVLLGEVEGDAKQAEDVDAIRRTFHVGWAAHWCEVFDGDPADSESELGALRDACQAGGTDEENEARCGACAEHAVRMLRPGTGADDWDATDPPLCQAFRDDGHWLYLPIEGGATPRLDAAMDWCQGEQAWALTDDALYRFSPSAEVGEAMDGAEKIVDLFGAPTGLVAAGTRAWFSEDGQLGEALADGTVTYFGAGHCLDPRGLAFDKSFDMLFATCQEDDTVVMFDTTTSPPSLVSTLDLTTADGGAAEEPLAVAVSPFGGEIAIATYEIYGDRDGLTQATYDETGFYTPTRYEPIYDVYEYSGGSVSRIEGLFYASASGVAFLDDRVVVSSNFSNLECPGGSSSSCGRLDSYFITVSDSYDLVPTHNLAVASRTTGVATLWDDKVAVAAYIEGDVHIVSSGSAISVEATVDMGYDRPDSIAGAKNADRVLVGFDDAGSTCGLGVIDASSGSASAWTFLGLDDSMGCVRYVAVP
ncbi:MAG: hypothetical protein H6742_13775 [Alphaproteobacteria bacterium]|nr:hypothetical protein [Alphaproteobacteria bacterium]